MSTLPSHTVAYAELPWSCDDLFRQGVRVDGDYIMKDFADPTGNITEHCIGIGQTSSGGQIRAQLRED